MELARLWDYMARKTKTGREARCRHRGLSSSQCTEISTLTGGWAVGGLHLTCSREARRCWEVRAASRTAKLSSSSTETATLPSPFCLFQACCQGHSSTSKEGGDMSRTAEFHQYTHRGHGPASQNSHRLQHQSGVSDYMNRSPHRYFCRDGIEIERKNKQLLEIHPNAESSFKP